MAGSYNHCVNMKTGQLYKPSVVAGMLEPGRDVYEAVEEMYGMIWFLADGRSDLVEEARQKYSMGLFMSPGFRAECGEDDE